MKEGMDMKCPYCGYSDSKVIDSRPTEDDLSIRRRRGCLQCGKRFTTYETVEQVPVMVVKRDGSRQAFDKEKMLRGMIRACYKRPVSAADLENAANEVELEVRSSNKREVDAQYVGDLVMEKLKALDEVSYVRFASVYRQFKDISTFREELDRILGERAQVSSSAE
jgi:transcriptional repressor NrdR